MVEPLMLSIIGDIVSWAFKLVIFCILIVVMLVFLSIIGSGGPGPPDKDDFDENAPMY